MNNTDLNIILDNIKAKIILSEIIGRDIHLTKKGREFVGNCPFHLEKTGSFFVNDEKGKYYCFGCGAHGDIISYIMESKGYGFGQALEFLANEAGVRLPARKVLGQRDNSIQKIMEECMSFFQTQLELTSQAKEYCVKRGLDQKIIDDFKIGYCPQNSAHLFQSLVRKGFKITDIKKTGVFQDNNTSKFKGRLIFPVLNSNNRVIAFGGRTMHPDEQPKYLNSSESVMFHKKETLYGYNIASKNVSNKGAPYIVVEGYVDVLMMHRFGFNTTVATMGTAFSSEHLLRLWKYCNEPIICFDGDQAGMKAMVRAAYVALEYISPGKTLKFCQLPDGADPDSYLNENSRESMNILIENSVYLIDFLWNSYAADYNSLEHRIPEHIAAWQTNIFEKLSVIKNPELLKMYKDVFKDRIKSFKRGNRIEGNNSVFSKNSIFVNEKHSALLKEAILLYIIVKYKFVLDRVAEKLSHITFSTREMNELKDCLLCETEIDDELNQEINRLAKIADYYCNFDNDEAEEKIVNFWNNIFDNYVLKDAYSNDIKKAKEDLQKDFNKNIWERFKALKIDSFLKKRQIL